MRLSILLMGLLCGGIVLLMTPLAHAQDTLAVGEVVVEGDSVSLPGGGMGSVTNVQSVLFTNRDSELGFTVDVNGDDGVWFDDGVLWLNSQASGFTLTGGEFTMGIGDDGEFIYSPSIDGDDGVWTDQGFLAAENQQAPAVGTDTLTTFHSRPTMDGTGTAYWVAGLNDGTLSTSTNSRVLYTSPDRTPGSIAIVLRGGDTVSDGSGSFAITASGIAFDYEFSEDGSQYIQELTLDTLSTEDGAIYVNGLIVAREGQSNGTGDNWDNFDLPRISSNGDYGWTGDTDGDTASDEFLSINGTILLREGDTVDGLTLGSTIRGFDFNDNGTVVFGWTLTSTTDEGLFVADMSDVAGTATLIARTGDFLDVDDDGTPEWVIADVNPSSGQGALSLSPDDVLFVSLGVEPAGGGTEVDGAFRFDLGDGADFTVTATPSGTVVGQGGSFNVAYEVCNNTTSSATGGVFFEAFAKPSLNSVASGTITTGSLAGGACTGTLNYTQNVPLNAPTGDYRYCVKAGSSVNNTVAEACFQVTVTPPPAARGGASAWSVVDASPWPSTASAGTALAAARAGEVVAYPNPFARRTTLSFALAEAADVRLVIYDVLGREVAVLVEGALEAGTHVVPFEARRLATGTYTYQLQVGNTTDTGRVTIVR